MLTTKAQETIGKDFRMTESEARALVAKALEKGWMSVRKDAHIVQFAPGSNYGKVVRKTAFGPTRP